MRKNQVANWAMVAGVVVVVAAVAFVRSRRAEDVESSAPATPPALVASPAVPPPQTQIAAMPKMIDLGADKCIPCKQMAPILAELKDAYAGRAEIVFIDVWKNPDAGKEYGVRVIPTQIFYDGAGNEVWRHEGFLPKEEIVTRLTELGAG